MAEQPKVDFLITAKNATKQAFSEIERSMRSVEGASGTLQTSLAGLGAGLSIAGIAAFAKSGINAADDLGKLSQKLGVSVESLSAFQYAAKLADVSGEELSTGLRQLAKNAQDAQSGTGDAKDAFKALGIAVQNSSGQLKGTEQLLLDVSEKFAGIEDGAGKTALAMKIFGRAGAQLIPLLNGGRTGFEELRKEAERLGLVISGETAKAAEQFNDNLTRVAASADALKYSLANGALPYLNKLLEQMIEGQRIAGGFGDALRLFGLSTITSSNAGEKIKEIRTELERIQDLRAKPRPGVGKAMLDGLDSQISDLKKQLEYAKLLQRQVANGMGGGDTAGERARMGGAGGKAVAPKLPGTETKDKRFDTAIEQLTQEGQKVQELTRFEEILADIQRDRYGNLSQAQKDRLIALAAEVDLNKEDARVQKEADELAKKYATEQVERIKREAEALDQLAQKYKDLADPFASLVRQRQEIQALEEKGALSGDQATAAIFAIDEQIEKMQGLDKQIKDTDNTAEEFGLTMSSALGRLITEGGDARDVIRALGQDLLQIYVKKQILEPVAKGLGEATGGIGEWFSGLFKAEGGPVSGGSPYIVGERGPELFVPGGSGSIVPNHALGGAGIVVNNNIQMSANSPAAAREAVYAMLPMIKQQTVAAVRDDRNRSGDRR